VKRLLSDLAKRKFLSKSGEGRSTTYTIATIGRLITNIDAKQYCSVDPDSRSGNSSFNFNVLEQSPAELFTDAELHILQQATAEWEERTASVSTIIAKIELERLVIELAWKSSKIEGNTYTLLDTERLIVGHKEALGHDKNEARMILNHKEAFTLIHENAREFLTLKRSNLEHVHGALVKGLGVRKGLRTSFVGVIGSLYRPLDNMHQIADAVDLLSKSIGRMTSPYAKALFALLGISYIQPFEDGNKRTSRLMANALLLSHGCAPLSYRSVDEDAYREAMLVFYEINSMVPFKKIFIEQYIFAAKNYTVK
jgi:Fic family protein